MQEKCSVQGCCKPVAVKKHKLCTPHYARLKRKGNPGGARINVRRDIKAWKPEVIESSLRA